MSGPSWIVGYAVGLALGLSIGLWPSPEEKCMKVAAQMNSIYAEVRSGGELDRERLDELSARYAEHCTNRETG